MGAGSAAAVTGPEKMYLSSDRGGDWKTGPTFMAAADNNNDVYEFRGVPFVSGELFLFSDSKFDGWKVNKRLTTEGKNDVAFDTDFSGRFIEGSMGCWKANNAGLYDITIDYSNSTIEVRQVAVGLAHVYRLKSAIRGNSGQVDIMTCSDGIWEYAGTLNEGQFGIQECDPATGTQTKWMGGACSVNDANTPVSFSDNEDSANSQSNLSGDYIVRYDPAKGTIVFIDTQDNIEGVFIDENGSAYVDEPQMTDLLLPYWVGDADTSRKLVRINDCEQAGLSSSIYGWVKYEDISDYEQWKLEINEAEKIASNTTNEHDCMNFNDAYYRCYQYCEGSRPGKKDGTVSAASVTGRRAPRAVPQKGSQNSRVARSFAMKDNTTGIEDIVTDGGESVEETDAPVVWYNLQGQRVSNPSGGIFIRQQGTKVTKEYIR